MTDAEPTFTFLSVEDVLSLHEDAIDAWGVGRMVSVTAGYLSRRSARP